MSGNHVKVPVGRDVFDALWSGVCYAALAGRFFLRSEGCVRLNERRSENYAERSIVLTWGPTAAFAEVGAAGEMCAGGIRKGKGGYSHVLREARKWKRECLTFGFRRHSEDSDLERWILTCGVRIFCL